VALGGSHVNAGDAIVERGQPRLLLPVSRVLIGER
jgi:hypothetical protein